MRGCFVLAVTMVSTFGCRELDVPRNMDQLYNIDGSDVPNVFDVQMLVQEDPSPPVPPDPSDESDTSDNESASTQGDPPQPDEIIYLNPVYDGDVSPTPPDDEEGPPPYEP